MVAVPAFSAVMSPLCVTVATLLLLDDHSTLLMVALAGDTMTLACTVSPTVSEVLGTLTLTSVTFT